MVDTLENVLYPLRIASFIVGIGMPKDSMNHLKRRLSIFYLFTLWIVYACIFNYVVISFKFRRHFVSMFMVLLNQFVAVISISIVICDNKKFGMCIKRLDFVDDTLEELGIPKEYRKMHNSVIWALVIWFVMICLTSTADSLWSIESYNDTSAMIIPLVMDYTLHANTLTDIMFILLLKHIRTRLDKINDHIGQLSVNEECGLRCTWRKSIITIRPYITNIQNGRRLLWTAMHLHSEICRIARDMNSLFGIQMALQMMSYFVVLTSLIFLRYKIILCSDQSHKDHRNGVKFFIVTDFWFFIFLTKLISMNHICESASNKAQKTKEIVHKLTNLARFDRSRKEIYQFVLQLSHRPLKFSGMGLFYFGYTFIHKFFVQILTFIIIMLQMDTSSKSTTSISNYNISCYTM